MKKLNKLHINSDRLMRNEELVKLRGGYDTCDCVCFGYGYMVALDLWECKANCSAIGAIGGCQASGTVIHF